MNVHLSVRLTEEERIIFNSEEMQKITLTAPAKLNLCLEIIKRYDNGFHEIRSIMIKSGELYDDVVVEFFEDREDIVIECDDPNVPTDEENIVYKIAEGFFQKVEKRVGIKIGITKRIPMLAGLGGGSSDGASVLLALNEYFGNVRGPRSNLRISEDSTLGVLNMENLVEIASEVGKDIPFFLQEAVAAYVSGAGEEIESIVDFPRLPMLVVNPKVDISTPWAYGQLDQRQWFMDNPNRKNISLAMKNNAHTVEDIARYVYNDFSFVAMEQCKEIGEIQNALMSFGARATSISGKGPTVFGIFTSHKELDKAKALLQKHYTHFFIATF